MIPIKKQAEPKTFKQAQKSNPLLSYKDFSEEEDFKAAFFDLRQSLLEEQGYICCYCQQKVKRVLDENTKKPLMTTEHFIPKKGKFKDESKQLDYNNLLAACLGNKDSKKENHCDSSKDEDRLAILPNPAEVRQHNLDKYIKYKVKELEEEVIVIPADPNNEELRNDINKILNLNQQNLKNKRFRVWKGLWRIVCKNNKCDTKKVREILAKYQYFGNIDPKKRNYEEFCGFIYAWFESRFKNEIPPQ